MIAAGRRRLSERCQCPFMICFLVRPRLCSEPGAAYWRTPSRPRRSAGEDIVDTGRSIAYAIAELHRCEVGDLWTCVLLDKSPRREIEVTLDFLGFSVSNLFLVAYGTDY